MKDTCVCGLASLVIKSLNNIYNKCPKAQIPLNFCIEEIFWK